MQFHGFKRENGRYGVRNHIIVISSVCCANGVVAAIERECPDVIMVQNAYGCAFGPQDVMTQFAVLTGLANNPNVGAVLIVGLGCEIFPAKNYVDAIKGKPVEAVVIQDAGSAATTRKGIEIVARFREQLSAQRRVEAPFSDLIVGLKCGGSDAFSGVTANPAVGSAVDLLVEAGSTAVMGEVTEMIGTAHILKKRCVDSRLGNELAHLITDHDKDVHEALGELAGLVISPGNMDGGLSSITEKSLGCNAKSGSTAIQELVAYGAVPSKKGLVIMNTPGYDIDAMAGMAAGGAQIILFTTGRGTPAGCPAVPVIKISSNSQIFRKMEGDIDINAGSILDEGKSIDEVGHEILTQICEIADGKLTCAEINRSIPFNYLKQGMTF
jgi:altronate dehydratase large subunit